MRGFFQGSSVLWSRCGRGCSGCDCRGLCGYRQLPCGAGQGVEPDYNYVVGPGDTP